VWTDLCKALALFPTVVLTWLDEAGYPVSVRLAIEPVDGQQVLRFDAPEGLELRAGPASVMSHSHDEQTWKLKSFMARGRLELLDQAWVFRPLSFIPGAGVGSPLDQLRAALRLRPTAKRYLAKHGIARPAIPWQKIKTLY
jgi:hypothetical protein